MGSVPIDYELGTDPINSHNIIYEQFKDDLLREEAVFSDFKDIQTNINILRQFEYWYKNYIND